MSTKNTLSKQSNSSKNSSDDGLMTENYIAKSTDYVVAFVGLPSAGKSSIINSLLHKRALKSGVCRTTVKSCVIDEPVIDDGGNKFTVLDLPGMCDSEEMNNIKTQKESEKAMQDFRKMTYDSILEKQVKMVCWISDVQKAFMTTHEVNEYNALKKYLDDHRKATGTLCDIMIILSKCDQDPNNTSGSANKSNDNGYGCDSDDYDGNEIEDDEEDTNLNDLILQVRNKFADDDIVLFNAYGRAYHSPQTTPIYKNFIAKHCNNISKHNIIFNITQWYSTFPKRQSDERGLFFNNKYGEYATNQTSVDVVVDSYDKLTIKHKTNVVKHHVREKDAHASTETKELQYKSYNFLLNIYKNQKQQSFIKSCKYKHDLIWTILNHNFKIMNNGEYSANINYAENYKYETIMKFNTELFKQLPSEIQESLIDKLLFDKELLKAHVMVCDFLHTNLKIEYYLQFEFYKKINNALSNPNTQSFWNMANVVLECLNRHSTTTAEQYQSFTNSNNVITFVDQNKLASLYATMVKNYKLFLDDKMVLLTKLEIGLSMFTTPLTTKLETCSFNATNKFSGNVFEEFKNTDEYRGIIKNFATRVFSGENKGIRRDKTIGYRPLNLHELMF